MFNSPLGPHRLTTLPMGHTNAVQIYQADMAFILQDEIPHHTMPFIDDRTARMRRYWRIQASGYLSGNISPLSTESSNASKTLTLTVFNREPHSGSGGSEFPAPFRTWKDQRYFSNNRNRFWKVLMPFRTWNRRKHFNRLTILYVCLNLSLPFCYSTYSGSKKCPNVCMLFTKVDNP